MTDTTTTEMIALPASWDCAHGPADDEPFCAEVEDDSHVCPTIRVHPDDAEAFAALVAEAHRLRTELAPYEMLAPQQCAAGKHADWLVDSEYAHACPWCAFEEAVRVSEALNRRLSEEQLAGSALYAALTMPTTPEQRQAALDKFTAVAQQVFGSEAAR